MCIKYRATEVHLGFYQWTRQWFRAHWVVRLLALAVPFVAQAVVASLGVAHAPSRGIEDAVLSSSNRMSIFRFSWLIHWIVATAIALHLSSGYLPRRELANGVKARLDHAIVRLSLIWWGWSATYLVFFVHTVVGNAEVGEPFIRLLKDLTNCAQAIILLLAYEALAPTTSGSEGGRIRLESTRLAIMAIGMLFIVDIATAPAARGGPNAPEWRSVLGSLHLVAIGTALAMFVSRLARPDVELPGGVIMTLGLYAVIQVLFNAHSAATILRAALLNIALLMKIVLYLVVLWLMHTGRIERYVSDGGVDAGIEN